MSFHSILNVRSKSFLAALLFGAVAVAPAIYPAKALAAVTNATPAAKISFSFDDGLASAATIAQPTLAKYGLVGTNYVITKCVGMTKKNNTCHANTDATYMTWAQIKALQTAGWEIGSHTATHPYLASFDATDGQPAALTPAQVTAELGNSKADLAAQGITATAFSTPYGDYTNSTLAQIAKFYSSHRGFADQNVNNWPYNDYLLNNFQVQSPTTVAQVEAKIDAAIAAKQWLVLTMHNIAAKPSANPDDYEWSTANLTAIAAYVKAKQTAGLLQSTTVSNGLVTSTTSLLANGSFNNGVTDGWSTDSPATITGDSGSNGSYPDATRSIKLGSNATGNAHLFSPLVSVDPNTTYAYKNFLNTAADTSGAVDFYVDEYDASGNWISGQWKTSEAGAFVEDINFTYKPGSQFVAKASLQVIVSGTGVKAYLDNSQMFALNSVAAPVLTNLLANGTFDAGLGANWHTNDPANITADAGSHGDPANVINSIQMLSKVGQNNHLFSPLVSVDSTKNYKISSYLNLVSMGGGVAYYVDEYDASGNWISGQYKLEVSKVSAGTQAFAYKPSSTSVKSASLQVINMAGVGGRAYVDSAGWYQL